MPSSLDRSTHVQQMLKRGRDRYSCGTKMPIYGRCLEKSPFDQAPTSSFNELILWLWNHATQSELHSALTLMWASWFIRNKQVMSNERVDAVTIAIGFSNMVHDYEMYASKVYRVQHPRSPIIQHWVRPRTGWVKANFDAHVGSGLCRGLGAVLRDDNGQLLMVGTKRCTANWDTDTTEAAAGLYALELARRSGYSYVILAAANRDRGLTPRFLLCDSIFALCLYFEGFKCVHVSRKGNTIAHLAARRDTGNVDEMICMNPFPPSLQTLVDLDLS